MTTLSIILIIIGSILIAFGLGFIIRNIGNSGENKAKAFGMELETSNGPSVMLIFLGVILIIFGSTKTTSDSSQSSPVEAKILPANHIMEDTTTNSTQQKKPQSPKNQTKTPPSPTDPTNEKSSTKDDEVTDNLEEDEAFSNWLVQNKWAMFDNNEQLIEGIWTFDHCGGYSTPGNSANITLMHPCTSWKFKSKTLTIGAENASNYQITLTAKITQLNPTYIIGTALIVPTGQKWSWKLTLKN